MLVWTNHSNPGYGPGVPVWDYVMPNQREHMKDRMARAAYLNEVQEFETSSDSGEHYHVWIWPVNTADIGVCLIGIRIPDEIARLTPRERSCLERLAHGNGTADVARELDVSVSTVHTYLRRSREKLQLANMEQLIGFASRYLPPLPPDDLLPP
jgi:DNA-binding CsgD family transcriptional regulator